MFVSYTVKALLLCVTGLSALFPHNVFVHVVFSEVKSMNGIHNSAALWVSEWVH